MCGDGYAAVRVFPVRCTGLTAVRRIYEVCLRWRMCKVPSELIMGPVNDDNLFANFDSRSKLPVFYDRAATKIRTFKAARLRGEERL